MVWKGVPMKKLLFIVNPRAGKTKSRAPLFDAAAEFSHAGYEHFRYGGRRAGA